MIGKLLTRLGRRLGSSAFGRAFVDEATRTVLREIIEPHSPLSTASKKHAHTRDAHNASIAVHGRCTHPECAYPETRWCPACWGTSIPSAGRATRCLRCNRELTKEKAS